MSAPSATNPPIAGYLDVPIAQARCPGVIEVVGWSFSTSGPIDTVEVYLDGVKLGDAVYGQDRPDVVEALSDTPTSSCGFHGRFRVPDNDGHASARTLCVRVSDSRGGSVTFERPVVVVPSARIEACLDSPRHGEKCRGFIEVSGWAFSHTADIEAVAVILDGRELGRAVYGHVRLDVLAAVPEAKRRCCFYERFDLDDDIVTSDLKTLTVTITDSAGNSVRFERSILVSRPRTSSFKVVGDVLEALGLDRFDLKIKASLNKWKYRTDFRLQSKNARFRKLGARDGLPLPPVALVYLVSGQHDIETFYDRSGVIGAESIQNILAKNGLDIARFASILDFGCGCGRLIRQWKRLSGRRIRGTDTNPRMIEWCKRSLRFAEFQRNGNASRLDYADEAFDFIYAISVFTHLTEEMQGFWIDELTRVLNPGGYLYLTVHGRTRARALPPRERQAFEAGQLVVVNKRLVGTNACSTFHPEKYLRERFSRNLRIVDFIPDGAEDAGQDAVLFRKP